MMRGATGARRDDDDRTKKKRMLARPPSPRAAVTRSRAANQMPPASDAPPAASPAAGAGPPGGDEGGRWAAIWASEATPAFDAGASPRALVDLLASPDAPDVKGKRVLIPGAGRGYDSATFVRAGAAEAVALDIVPAAVAAATSWLASPASGLDGGKGGTARAVCGDFFNLPAEAGAPFDVGFDYTFFCALPPAWRGDWGKAWARALKAPGGVLVTLQFPMSPPDDPARPGPPWPVSHDAYAHALEPAGFVRVHDAKVPDGHSAVSGAHDRNGREWLSVWVLGGGGGESEK
jgi:methyl halide transferase